MAQVQVPAWIFLCILLPWSVLSHVEEQQDRCHRHVGNASVEDICHCYRYEKIHCGAAGEESYQEHIQELESFCFSNCTYECLQPLEVLRVHYRECPRAKSPIYVQAVGSACLTAVEIVGEVLNGCDVSPRNELAALWAFLLIFFGVLFLLVCVNSLWRRSQKKIQQGRGVEMKERRNGHDVLEQDEQPITLA